MTDRAFLPVLGGMSAIPTPPLSISDARDGGKTLVNSEELELSLRSEFETHLKKIFADVQQQVTDFQDKIDAELGKHRTQMLDALGDFTSRMSAEPEFDQAFSEAVAEHLKIARDDGAQIAAKAMANAETMDSASPSSVSFNFARDAVNEISSQTSQAAILQALVRHCEHFTPRGIFFIVRNEHFVGWQALGDESHVDQSAVRALNFPVSSDTVLSDAVSSLHTVERKGGTGNDESTYLRPLGFKPASGMRAIPLVARGRGVATLYIDGGTSDRPVNIEALEMLVRVAGLTVELLASNQAARPMVSDSAAKPVEEVQYSEPEAQEQFAEAEHIETQDSSFEPQAEPEAEPQTEEVPAYEVESFERQEEPAEAAPVAAEIVESFESTSHQDEAVTEPELEAEKGSPGFEFSEQYEADVQHFDDADVVEPPSFEANGAAPAETAPEPDTSRTMSGTRRLDLPIEVAEEERGTHTKARRFARLLVSEIKLYNEDKVKQGRESGDLYDRLKEAIDRSREMYDKRVEPPVSSMFDYFHYELVNDLAEGDLSRLGSGYPGAAV